MNNANLSFVPSHYPCIGAYEIDVTSGCSVNCCYCGLKKTAHAAHTNIPGDLKEKGIYLSPNSDPFAKLARDGSHELLERFLPQGVQFLIITKSYIPTCTMDLLAKYAPQVYVQISISRLDNELNNIIEPCASTARERLEIMSSLVASGVRVVPCMMPLFPGIDDTDTSLTSTIIACANAGAKYLKAAYAVLDYTDVGIVKRMIAHPILKQSFHLMTEYQKIHIGGGLTTPKTHRMQFYERITQLCAEHGLRFQACPILDPAVLENNNVCLCATFRKKNN
ncbi:MAG: radical SAM protein [candidate division SR1 bacterium]|nr:radical SAM protein [candidate division SR1 bacterium]